MNTVRALVLICVALGIFEDVHTASLRDQHQYRGSGACSCIYKGISDSFDIREFQGLCSRSGQRTEDHRATCRSCNLVFVSMAARRGVQRRSSTGITLAIYSDTLHESADHLAEGLINRECFNGLQQSDEVGSSRLSKFAVPALGQSQTSAKVVSPAHLLAWTIGNSRGSGGKGCKL
jgi:hypothetical protein